MWEGVASVKHEAQAQILDMLQTWQSDLSLSQSQWERKKWRERKRGKESDSDSWSGRDSNPWPRNDLPYSNQLSYQVTRQLSMLSTSKSTCISMHPEHEIENYAVMVIMGQWCVVTTVCCSQWGVTFIKTSAHYYVQSCNTSAIVIVENKVLFSQHSKQFQHLQLC